MPKLPAGDDAPQALLAQKKTKIRMSNSEDTVRAARAEMGDDLVLPFTVEKLNVRGRIAHLGAAVDKAVRQHAYPEPVARLLGEMLALTALLGTTLKFQGKLIAQAQTDGPVRLLVADFTAPGFVRGLARFDEEAVHAAMEKGKAPPEALLGSGQLVFTLDQGPHTQRYQGMVALSGALQQAAEEYFRQSEQIPTRVRLAAGPLMDENGAHWRAGALLIQHLPPPGGAEDDERQRNTQNEDDWNTAQALFDTLEDQELLDPVISPERLAYRLFHDHDVRAFEPVHVQFRCGCSREGLLAVLRRFSQEELRKMVEDDGHVHARCEFCTTTYVFSLEELTAEAPQGKA